MVLEEGVLKGRETFGNIIKYLNMTASSNFGNVFSVLIASAFIPFLPMLAIQILIQNLMYDVSQLALPWDRMDREFLMRPRKWDARNIGRFMLWIGPTSSIFDVTTFALLWFVFGANSPSINRCSSRAGSSRGCCRRHWWCTCCAPSASLSSRASRRCRCW